MIRSDISFFQVRLLWPEWPAIPEWPPVLALLGTLWSGRQYLVPTAGHDRKDGEALGRLGGWRSKSIVESSRLCGLHQDRVQRETKRCNVMWLRSRFPQSVFRYLSKTTPRTTPKYGRVVWHPSLQWQPCLNLSNQDERRIWKMKKCYNVDLWFLK